MANIHYSTKQAIWSGEGNQTVSGYTIHTTAVRGESHKHSSLRQIGAVFQRGAKQTGKWAALRSVRDHAQHGFTTRADAARWLLTQDLGESEPC
jgi:hypothetical protein